MPTLRLSRSASVTSTPEGVLLRSDLGDFKVSGADLGAFLDRVLPLLDGSRERDAVCDALAPYARASVEAFLDLLAERGLLEDPFDAPGRARGQRAFLRQWSLAPELARERLTGARVLLVGLDPWGATAAYALATAGVGALHLADDHEVDERDVQLLRGGAILGVLRRDALAEQLRRRSTALVTTRSLAELDFSPPVDLMLAALPPDDLARVEQLAALAHRHGVRSLWSHLDGEAMILGPLVTPRQTACRLCAAAEGLAPAATRSAAPPPDPFADALAHHLGQLVATEALKVLTDYTGARLGGRLRIQRRTLETEFHTLVRLPWCRVCGDGT